MAVRNLSGQVLRFVDSNDQVIATLQPEATVVSLEAPDTIGSISGVKTRVIHCASPQNLPAAVGGTYILVAKGLLKPAYDRGLARADVFEPEDEVLVNEEVCYRAARRYAD